MQRVQAAISERIFKDGNKVAGGAGRLACTVTMYLQFPLILGRPGWKVKRNEIWVYRVKKGRCDGLFFACCVLRVSLIIARTDTKRGCFFLDSWACVFHLSSWSFPFRALGFWFTKKRKGEVEGRKKKVLRQINFRLLPLPVRLGRKRGRCVCLDSRG